jgi:hypothetical protein
MERSGCASWAAGMTAWPASRTASAAPWWTIAGVRMAIAEWRYTLCTNRRTR